ncbi:CubicO group peptidase, beta-lactamase class C family [Nonomuraea solani]|uniref:CubicO group peptidase, beta-lactamase class C family n=1 Tax=Nonomuraea solani TaxID=1144553 RepID=A0A1H6EQ94_9ACTN|nr:serine hydrolase domain-containing protein [Nonomuraea solani]SEG98864.1 CubicO group peptidase, beta-lactamase class C family [Nonomuraea solani]
MLADLIAEHRVPGAVLAVYANGEFQEHAAGVLNTRTGVEVTTDSLFQIGSISKVWTATLALQLVEEGKLDLDRPVRAYLPEFRLADESAAALITTRHLLCHMAGFEGDLVTDTGRGDDAIARYVESLAEAPQVFAPGELFSYNNAGYCVIGRIIEVLRGKPYIQCLRDHLIQPLKLTHTATDADEAILHRAAVGHAPEPVGLWALPRSLAPAGSALTMTARDLLTFARGHLSDDGTAVAMRAEQVHMSPITAHGDAWALGWEVFHVGEHTIYGHNGDTIGQSAFLRLVPERDLAVALLTNGGEGVPLHHELFSHVLRELAGIDLPALPTPSPGPAIDASRYVGGYGNAMLNITISQDESGTIWADQTGSPRFRLLPHDGDTLISAEPAQGIHRMQVFVGDDGHGRARFLHIGRALPRLPDQPLTQMS